MPHDDRDPLRTGPFRRVGAHGVKKLERIRHRRKACRRGRSERPRLPGRSPPIHSLADDHTRWAHYEVLSDETGPTYAAFLGRAVAYFLARGTITIKRVLTDHPLADLGPPTSRRWATPRHTTRKDTRRSGQGGLRQPRPHHLMGPSPSLHQQPDRAATVAPWLEALKHYTHGAPQQRTRRQAADQPTTTDGMAWYT